MKSITRIIASAIAIGCIHITDAQSLREKFLNPPDDCRTKVWWFHGETESDRRGMELDLQEFKDKGIGGVVFYDQVHTDAADACPSMSPQWWESLKYAARKASDLGLGFEVAASNGYVAGGPYITPESGMKKTAFTDTLIEVNASGRLKTSLPAPGKNFRDVATIIFPDSPLTREIIVDSGRHTLFNDSSLTIVCDAGSATTIRGISYTVSPRGKGSTSSMNIPGKRSTRYFGAKYVELPPVGILEYSDDARSWHLAASLPGIDGAIGHKSRDRSVSFPAVTGRYFRITIKSWLGPMPGLNKLVIENIRLSTRDIINNWQVLAGLRTEVRYNEPAGGDFGAVARNSIRIVSPPATDGSIDLSVPRGFWRVIRFGYIPTGAKTKHGRKNMLGLECDAMSAKAARIHYTNYVKQILDTLRTAGCRIRRPYLRTSHSLGRSIYRHSIQIIFFGDSPVSGIFLIAYK